MLLWCYIWKNKLYIYIYNFDLLCSYGLYMEKINYIFIIFEKEEFVL